MTTPTKTYKKGRFTLEHSIIRNDFGQLENYMEVSFFKPNGTKIRVPVFEPFKVRMSGSFFELNTYTEKEYEKILDNFIISVDAKTRNLWDHKKK